MKKLYYVVEMETGFYDDESLIFSGNKLITTYVIENNELKSLFNLDLTYEDNTEKEIKDYLNNNGYENKSFELVRL